MKLWWTACEMYVKSYVARACPVPKAIVQKTGKRRHRFSFFSCLVTFLAIDTASFSHIGSQDQCLSSHYPKKVSRIRL